MAGKDKREIILKALEGMMRNRRFHEVTLDDVAKAARVGKGTIYRYFSDKDDLFFQLATHGHDELCEAIERSASGDNHLSFRERLVAMCERIVAFFEGRMALIRVMGEHEGRMPALQRRNREELGRHRQRLHAAVLRVLERGVPGGRLRDDIASTMQVRFLLGLLRTRGPMPMGEVEEKPAIATIVDVFLNGMRTRDAESTAMPSSIETESRS